MHLIILGQPRSGSHMVESMIAPAVAKNLGRPMMWTDETHPANMFNTWPLSDFWAANDLARGVVLSTVTFGPWDWLSLIDPAVAAGAKLLILTRRDKLAAWCSLDLSRQHGLGWDQKSPVGFTIDVDPERARLEKTGWLREEQVALNRWPARTAQHLFYEDITVASVQAALDAMGVKLTAQDATTEKFSPPLSEYVENLTEVRASTDPVIASVDAVL